MLTATTILITWYTAYPNVYVDGVYVGQAPITIQVTEGYHAITVDNPTLTYTGANRNNYLTSITDQDNNQYSNGAFVPIFSDTTITVNYYLQY